MLVPSGSIVEALDVVGDVIKNERLLALIRDSYAASGGVYGSPPGIW